MAEALYRKYRPQIFEDVVGQEHIERTIKNAIEQDKVSHAYLFTGPRGTGKTTTARLLAKALLCEKGPTAEPDGTCGDCEAIANGTHPDVYELDAASRTGVENVREEIIGRVQFAPTQGRYKVYIIDEVHMLSTAAFNALLKTLEEPPDHVVFILATTDPQKVPETIHSRCQRFDFHRISIEALVSRLGAICVAEGVEFEGEALDLIAHRAEGGMRNALTSLEQVIAFGDGKVTMETAERMLGSISSNDLSEIVVAIGTRDVARCFSWTAEYVETGADLAQFVRDLAEHMRNMYVLSLSSRDTALEVSDMVRKELVEESKYFGPDRLTRTLGILGDLASELRTSTNPRLSFEIALTRLVRPDSDVTLESLAERMEALESGYSAASHVSAVTSQVAQVAAAPVQQTYAAQPQQVAAPAPVQEQVSAVSAPSQQSIGATPTVPQQAVAPTAQASASVMQTSSLQAPTSADVAQPAAPLSADQGSPTVATSSAPSPTTPSMSSSAVSTQAPQPASSTSAVTAENITSPAPEQSAPVVCAPAGAEGNPVVALSNPAALQRVWQAALKAIKKEKAAYGVLFLNTKIHFNESSQELAIEFPGENVFAYSAVQKPEIMDVVTRSLHQAVGAPVIFRYTQADGAGQSASSTHTQPPVQQPAGMPVAAQQATAQPSAPITPSQSGTAAPTQAAATQQPAQSQQATGATSDQPSAAASPLQSPASDQTPLDAYDSYAPTDRDVEGYDVGPANAVASTPQATGAGGAATGVADQQPAPAAAGDNLDENALKAMLSQEYGDGIVFGVVEDE